MYSKVSPAGDEAIKTKIFVFYVPEKHEICWRDEESLQEQSFSIKMLSEIFVGPHRSIHPKQKRESHGSSRKDTFLSLIGKTTQLHLEARDRSQAKSWVQAVHAIALHLSEEVADKMMSHRSPKNGNHSTHKVGTTSSTSTASTLKPSPSSIRGGVIPEGVIPRLRAGAPFYRYHWNAKSQLLSKEHIFMQYECLEGDKGADFTESLCFWPVIDGATDTRPASSTRLVLGDIEELMIGKHSSVLKSSAAEVVDESCCFTIVTKTGEMLDLEAESKGKLAVWTYGLVRIFSGKGHTMRTRTINKRSHTTAIDPAEFRQGGQFFKHDLVIATSDGGQAKTHRSRPIRLWYDPDPSRGKAGALCWLPRKGTAKLCWLALHTIVQLTLGKKAGALKASQAKEVCITLVVTCVAFHFHLVVHTMLEP